MKQLKKQISRGVYDPNRDDPFELFITSTNIRWCYYKESHKILGNTYGMLVLQVSQSRSFTAWLDLTVPH
jgi:N-acetyltransferase 10